MDNTWVTLILLGIAAAFMPMVYGLQVYTLGEDDGTKKVSSLLGGITSFRLLVSLGVVLLFAGVMAGLSQGLSDIGRFVSSLFSQLGQGITSGHHLVIDLLLIASGIVLIVQAFRRIRGKPDLASAPGKSNQSSDSSKSDDAKAVSVGIVGMLGLGLMMSATNVNQWLFVSTAVNQILRMQAEPWTQLMAFLLFFGIATVLIAIPLLLVLIRPQAAQGDLKRLNVWINGSIRYVVAGILGLIGLYFILQGGEGFVNFFAAR